MEAKEISDTITQLTDAFNIYDFDRIMSFFTDDAVYVTADGKTYRGKKEIRAAFEGHFNGEFGAFQFEAHDRVIDAENRRAASPWICRHDITHARARGGCVGSSHRCSAPGCWKPVRLGGCRPLSF